MARSTSGMITVNEKQLEAVIRKIVRQVVREEFQRAIQQHPEVIEKWMSDPESPLYRDMVELAKDIRNNKVRLVSDSEVWGA